MKTTIPVMLSCFVMFVIGCGKAPNRTIIDGTDLEAIRAYEAYNTKIEQEDSNVDWRAQGIAEEKAAAERMKNAAEEVKNEAP